MRVIDEARQRLPRANTPLMTLGIACLLVALIGEGLTVGGVSVSRVLPWWQHAAIAVTGLIFVGLSLVVGVQVPEGSTEPTPGFLGAPPHRIPSSRLVSRPEELTVLIEALISVDGRPVALVGMGGVGKTVLATEAAHAREVVGRFTGGIAWIDVDRRPDVVALQALLARRLGDREPAFVSVKEGRDQLTRLLVGRNVLVVLDNVWDREIVDAFTDLGTDCRLLFTTRYRELGREVDAVELEVRALTLQQALALLGGWTRTEVDTLPAVAERICRLLDNLALGVAMVGAMLTQRGRTWEDVLQLLENVDLEQVKADFGERYPHPNLLAAIELSIDDLPDEGTRQLYRTLGVFGDRSSFPRSAAESLWAGTGLSGPQVGELLALLEGRSLLSAEGSSRFRVHDLVMDVINKQLGADGLVQAHAQLLEGYRARCPAGWSSGPNDGYFLENLAYHLDRANRRDDLKELLADLSWMQVRLAATDLAGLMTDYVHASHTPVAHAVRAALGLSAGTLTKDSHQLPGHLTGRLIDHPDPAVRAVAEAWRRWDAWPWLCPLSPALISTTGALRAVLLGHTDRVNTIAIGPDGGLVVSGSEDGTVRVWALDSSRLERVLPGVTPVRSIAVSPDGQLVVSAGYDGTMHVWALAKGQLVRTLEGLAHWVRATAVSLDGALVIAVTGDGRVLEWDLISGRLVRVLEGQSWPPAGGWQGPPGLEAVAISPDRQTVISGGSSGPIRMWNLASRQLLGSLEGHADWVTAVAFSPDGRLAASAGRDTTVRVWEVATGLATRSLEGHPPWVTAVAVSREGRLVASGGEDGTVRVWELAGNQLVRPLRGHAGWVRAVAVSPDGQVVVSGGDDGMVQLHERASGRLLRALEGHTAAVWSVAVSRDGKQLVSGGNDGLVKVHELATGRLLRVWDLAAPDKADRGRTRAPADAGRLGTEVAARIAVYAVAFSSDGRLVVTAGEDLSVRLWDVASGRLEHTLMGHIGWVRAATVSPDDRQVVCGGNDGTVRVWDLASGRLERTLAAHEYPTHLSRLASAVWSVAVSPDGQHVVSGGNDRTVRLWELASGKLVHTLTGHTDIVTAVAVSPDGKALLSVSHDTVRIWELASGDELARWIGDYPVTGGCAVGSVHPFTIALGDAVGAVYTLELRSSAKLNWP